MQCLFDNVLALFVCNHLVASLLDSRLIILYSLEGSRYSSYLCIEFRNDFDVFLLMFKFLQTMNNQNFYLIMEVEEQTRVECIDCNDGVIDYGYEPQCVLLLKKPGRFSSDSIAVKLQGKAALHHFKKGDMVAVSLGFWKTKNDHEYSTRVTIDDIKLVKEIKTFVYE